MKQTFARSVSITRRSGIGITALFAALTLFFTGCGQRDTPSLPAVPNPTNASNISPQVWERGVPPVQWALFTHPTNSTHYAWPASDRANNIWFESDGRIERVNYSGSNVGTIADVTSGPLANLASSSDGSVWYGFSNHSQNYTAYLYAVNSSGSIEHEYAFTPTFLNGPGAQGGMYDVHALFAGVGNDMWEGGIGDDANTDGIFVRIHNGQPLLYRCLDYPWHGTVTADGNVWFVAGNLGGDFIDKLNTATGKCTEGEQVAESEPHPITVGSDGNVWTIDTGPNGSLLIRTNPSTGASTRLGVGLHYFISDLITGPDGDLWASYTYSTQWPVLSGPTGVLQISTSPKILGKFACPTSVCENQSADSITGLTTAPDGNIWFAYNGSDNYTGIGAYVRLAMTITPSSVAFSHVGQTQLLKIAEANYSGSWTVASTNSSVVKIVNRPSSNEATIQAAGPGTARVIVRDSRNNYYGVTVTVSGS